MKKITSPFLVKLHYSFSSKTKLYFVMDFVDGGELFYHMIRTRLKEQEHTTLGSTSSSFFFLFFSTSSSIFHHH